ncbi:unnamed protein product [Parascedosporium putredinis]|uniref:LisH domain-containing protein n=1 Tax=Parascedosporium putredinis TaxID=1442378 RepID=A0A9P1H2Z0_9PEZI|nr:unnamed protein product [Parascedosporium putredinis]CAI7995336.1 unnamed protein product [Parascedosporium putredinis]
MNPTTNVNMANLGGMGGPVGAAPMTMMNNVAAAQQGGPRQHAPINENQRTLLNTYIYEYFIRFGMHDCARTLLQGDNQVNVVQNGANRRRDENGNVLGNGVGGDAMDTDSKDEMDGKLPDDLPRQSFRGKHLFPGPCLNANTQNRLRQSQQQEMLRQMRPDMTQQQYQAQMMRMQNGGGMAMAGKQGLVRTAMANNHPQAMLHQAKQNQMQRDPSDMDGNRQRAGSPNAADNAPSPSKRPRLGEAAFNPNQPGMRQVQGIPGQQAGAPNLQHAHQLLISNGINPAQLSAQQLQQFSQQSPAVQAKSIATYSANLQHQQSQQMPNKVMGNAGMPQGQGSPMMPTGPDGTAIGAFYNPEMGAGPGGMRPGPGGPQAAGGSNHALQDYQLQLMLLEQQNKKRLMMARQEQDNMGGIPRDGPNGAPGPAGPPGPNGQIMPDGSPQAPRSGASPNPAEQMKRGTPQMNSTNMGSPIPMAAPNMNGSMVPNGQMAGMRPPSSHPNQQFAGPVNPQMMAGRGQQAPGNNQGNPQIQWQGGPNNNQMMPQGGPQGQQVQGTPQQRNSMPPPSGPAAAASNANNRNQTSSPQQNAQGGTPQPPTPSQSTKPAPKKKEPKNAKSKAAAQKKSNTNLNAAAAAAATSEPAADAEPPTPATPMTPGTASAGFKAGQTGGANAGAAAAASGPAGPQPTAASAPAPAAQPQQMHSDTTPGGGSFSMESSGGMDVFPGMDFTNPMHSSDVLNDFDFDAFLHEDGENNGFDFNSGYPAMEGTGEIGAE